MKSGEMMNTRIYENILNKHVQGILNNSDHELQKIFFQAENLISADGFLWNDIIDKTVPGLLFENGMIFAGPDGCGKHTAAAIAIKRLMESKQKKRTDEFYSAFVYLTGKDFVFSEDLIDADLEYRSELDADDYCLDIVHMHIDRLINLILQRFNDGYSDKNIVILMDDINKSDLCTQIYDWVAFYLNQMYLDFYSSDPGFPRMYVFVLTKNVLEIPHSLRDYLTLYKMEKPDENERKLFIDKKAHDISEKVKKMLVKESDHMTYMELRDYIFSVSKIEDADEAVVKKLAKDMLMPPVTNTGIRQSPAPRRNSGKLQALQIKAQRQHSPPITAPTSGKANSA